MVNARRPAGVLKRAARGVRAKAVAFPLALALGLGGFQFFAVSAAAQGACGRALLLQGGPPRTVAESNQREALRRECEQERASAQTGQRAAQARMAARGVWAEAPPAFRACLQEQLSRFGVTMDTLIQQDVFLGDPYLAELEAFCRSR
jgi:hypothetical protein